MLLVATMVTLGQDAPPPDAPPLPFPGMLAKEQREAGNPLATLAAMRDDEERYRASEVFAGIYTEVRLNYEQFLGVPDAGVRAMQLPPFQGNPAEADPSVLESFEPRAAIDVICERVTCRAGAYVP